MKVVKTVSKERKLISISKEMLQHLNLNKDISNFSEWVETQYRATFPVEKIVEIKVENLSKELENAKKELEEARKNLQNSQKNEYFDDEKTIRVYTHIYKSLQKGFDLDALFNYAVNVEGLNVDKKTFKAKLEEFKKQNIEGGL